MAVVVYALVVVDRVHSYYYYCYLSWLAWLLALLLHDDPQCDFSLPLMLIYAVVAVCAEAIDDDDALMPAMHPPMMVHHDHP